MATIEPLAEVVEDKPFFITVWWNNLSDFLHQARLIPFIIAVSGYHYFQVLKTHDEVFTAWPVAIFLDLLHYRTVQQAVETRKPLWIVAAVLTTGVAYAFQFIFYSGPGHSGELLPVWQQFLFASVVPIGIAFMVWHHHENAQKVESTLQADFDESQSQLTQTQLDLEQAQKGLEAAQNDLDTTQNQFAETQTTLEATQTELTKNQTELSETQLSLVKTQENLAATQNERDEFETQLVTTQSELNTAQSERDGLQAEWEQIQEQLEELKALQKIWGALNDRTQAAAQVAAGILTLDEAVQLTATPKETIRRHAKNMNGVKA